MYYVFEQRTLRNPIPGVYFNYFTWKIRLLPEQLRILLPLVNRILLVYLKYHRTLSSFVEIEFRLACQLNVLS